MPAPSVWSTGARSGSGMAWGGPWVRRLNAGPPANCAAAARFSASVSGAKGARLTASVVASSLTAAASA